MYKIIIISLFIKIRIKGIRWRNKDKWVFWGDWLVYFIYKLLWEILTYIIIENEVVAIDIIRMSIIVEIFQLIILDIIKISLNVLIVGGAEILTAININHQKVILGKIEINPLNNNIFRVWYFIYKSLTKKNNADDDNPWAIIIIIAPVNPIEFMVNNAVITIPMWATLE